MLNKHLVTRVQRLKIHTHVISIVHILHTLCIYIYIYRWPVIYFHISYIKYFIKSTYLYSLFIMCVYLYAEFTLKQGMVSKQYSQIFLENLLNHPLHQAHVVSYIQPGMGRFKNYWTRLQEESKAQATCRSLGSQTPTYLQSLFHTALTLNHYNWYMGIIWNCED